MTEANSAATNLGFLTIVEEPAGYVGGYLATNLWGKPLEFRLTSAVQPSKVQQILYGAALLPYLCGELIGKTLVDKTATVVQAVLTDHPAALSLRGKLEIPVGLVGSGEGERLAWNPDFPQDGALLHKIIPAGLDLTEPFERVRQALGEARKLGVGSRVA